jgi:hypothetical protein
MNKRIRELAEQAEMSANKGDHVDVKLMMENFAQLIACECANICDDLQDIPATEPRHCAEDIRTHFGVDE